MASSTSQGVLLIAPLSLFLAISFPIEGYQLRRSIQLGRVLNLVSQNYFDSFDLAERSDMKRASKKVRDEIRTLQRQRFDEIVAAVFPLETRTPEMTQIIENAFVAAGRIDGSPKNIDSLTEDKALEVKKKLGTVQFAMRDLMKNVHKKLPHDPGGRKKKFSVIQRGEVIQEILCLISQGQELRVAKAAVARKHRVSLSTVQRVWKQRGLLVPKV